MRERRPTCCPGAVGPTTPSRGRVSFDHRHAYAADVEVPRGASGLPADHRLPGDLHRNSEEWLRCCRNIRISEPQTRGRRGPGLDVAIPGISASTTQSGVLVVQPHSRGRRTYVIACTLHSVSGLRTLGFYGYLQPSRSYLGQQIFLLDMQRCGGNYWRPDKSEFVPPTN